MRMWSKRKKFRLELKPVGLFAVLAEENAMEFLMRQCVLV